MYNYEIKLINLDIKGSVTVTEIGKRLNRVLSMRKPKYLRMVDLSDLPKDTRNRIK